MQSERLIYPNASIVSGHINVVENIFKDKNEKFNEWLIFTQFKSAYYRNI